jgi:hypothetical protein
MDAAAEGGVAALVAAAEAALAAGLASALACDVTSLIPLKTFGTFMIVLL